MLTEFLTRLQETSLAAAQRESAWLFPTLESLHVLAIALVVGSIAMIDLRLLAVSSRGVPVTRTLREVLPWTWISFVAAVLTGGALFVSNAITYADNAQFQLKMVLLLLAGLNMLVFHLFTLRSVERWSESASTPMAARAAGAVSLALWIGIVCAGRWIGFAY